MLAAVVCQALGASVVVRNVAGVLAALAAAILFGPMGLLKVRRASRDYRPRFPSSPQAGRGPPAAAAVAGKVSGSASPRRSG